MRDEDRSLCHPSETAIFRPMHSQRVITRNKGLYDTVYNLFCRGRNALRFDDDPKLFNASTTQYNICTKGNTVYTWYTVRNYLCHCNGFHVLNKYSIHKST